MFARPWIIGLQPLALLFGLHFAFGVSLALANDDRIHSLVDPIEVPAAKHHALEQYVTAREAARYLAIYRETLMVDVRVPSDVAASGIAVPVVRNVPLYIDVPRSGGGQTTTETTVNPRLVGDIRSIVMQRGGWRLRPHLATIFLICTSGTHAAIAADELQRSGFARVYTIVDGFDGDVGPDGRRTINGWRQAGLPWTPQPRPSQRAKMTAK